MTTYTMNVLNNSNFVKNYVWFMQPPTVSGIGGSPQVYTNAWITFTGITPGSTDVVTYTDETYAYWANATVPVSPSSSIGQSGTASVNVATQDDVTFNGATSDGGVGFGAVQSPGSAATGSYRIVAQSDFNISAGYVFGLAQPGGVPGIPTPVATFVAEPNETYDITPIVKFYVADALATPGSIIDVAAFSTKSMLVDFTGLSETNAVVTQAADGSFSVAYY